MVGVILLAVGLVIVVKAASWLVDGASSLARALHISDLVIGLTVVAFGTSMPELAVSLAASIENKPAIAIGNILGSNIANILLILGVTSIIFPLKVSRGTVWKEIPLCLLAAVLVAVMGNDVFIDGAGASALTRIDGIVMLSFFIIFLFYTASIATDPPETVQQAAKIYKTSKAVVMIIAGLVFLSLGGKLVVSGAVRLALQAGISESIIAATIIAVGTSLPELATSVVAALKKNPDIAIGNVVGSNIFNIFLVLGISSVIRPLPFQPANQADLAAAVASSLLLFVFMFTGKKRRLDRWQGFVFLALYSGYLIYLAGQI